MLVGLLFISSLSTLVYAQEPQPVEDILPVDIQPPISWSDGRIQCSYVDNVSREILNKAEEKILALGISESYFDKQFTLCHFNEVKTLNVQWKYAVNEYETLLKLRCDMAMEECSFTNEIISLKEIKSTISVEEAKEKLEECLKDRYYDNANFHSDLWKDGSFVYVGTAFDYVIRIKEETGYAGVVNIETGKVECITEKIEKREVALEKAKEILETSGSTESIVSAKKNIFQNILAFFKRIFAKPDISTGTKVSNISTGYCDVPEDCKNQNLGPVVECVGEWTCKEHQCKFECGTRI